MSSSSIHDVARFCGVSTATVSRALRGLPNVSPRTRQRVQAAAAELGYVVSPAASALSTGRLRTIAVILPNMGRWFYAQLVEGIDEVLRSEGYDTFLVSLDLEPGRTRRSISESILRKRADAVIALGVDFTPEERRDLRAASLPTVVVGSPVTGVRSVGLDDEAAARTAMTHLLDLGHRHIAHIGGEDDYGIRHSVAATRRRGWRAGLAAAGIKPGADWFVSGAFLMPTAKVAAAALLARPERPTAIFAASDEMGFGALLAAHEAGIAVPRELSVVGIDDHSWSAAFGLTTVRQDPREQGGAAARIVLDELHGSPSPRSRQRVGGGLVVRASTAPPTHPSAGGPPAAGDRVTTVLPH